jgi:hypothetical protein
VPLRLNFYFTFLEHQILAHNSLPDVLDFLNDGLEVRGGIVRAGDEDVVSLTGSDRRVQWRD